MGEKTKGAISLLVIIFAIVIFFKINGLKKETPVLLDFSEPTPYDQVDTKGLKLFTGDLISVIQTNSTVVIKAKIYSRSTNKSTIDQNYFIVADLIKNHGFNTCKELQYWAVADMTDGSESKVISFTLDEETINKVFTESIADIQIGDYATDLWILPGLFDGK